MAKKQPKLTVVEPEGIAPRLFELFKSNQRSSGRFNPQTGNMFTEFRPLSIADLESHLEGSVGVGAVPILDDDTCWWAAIDIDNHDSDEDIPIAPVDEYITKNHLPLIPCRSKSGGIHVYMFMDKPHGCSQVRGLIGKWAAALGYSGSEIFPKQSKLAMGADGRKQLGNWINLPYIGGNKTPRYAMVEGKRLTVEQFLNRAEKLRLTPEQFKRSLSGDHHDAPPCVQAMFEKGVGQGHRNEALYNIGVYLRKSVPAEKYEAACHEANSLVFGKPLPRPEAIRTIASAKRPDYQYRCLEEPIRSLCDRDVCVTRKYGVSPKEYDGLAAVTDLPVFSELVRYGSDPARWEVKIDGAKVTGLPTEFLMNWHLMRNVVAERLLKIAPMIKQQEWARLLTDLMKEARVIEAPDEATMAGQIRVKLEEYCRKVDLNSPGTDIKERERMLRGQPCIQIENGEPVVMFRLEDFITYLKRIKYEELKGMNLWTAIKDCVTPTKRRIREYNVRVVYIPVKEITDMKPEKQEFKSEL
jgi:hypothetical protein